MGEAKAKNMYFCNKKEAGMQFFAENKKSKKRASPEAPQLLSLFSTPAGVNTLKPPP
jgi:hypothetical protein